MHFRAFFRALLGSDGVFFPRFSAYFGFSSQTWPFLEPSRETQKIGRWIFFFVFFLLGRKYPLGASLVSSRFLFVFFSSLTSCLGRGEFLLYLSQGFSRDFVYYDGRMDLRCLAYFEGLPASFLEEEDFLLYPGLMRWGMV